MRRVAAILVVCSTAAFNPPLEAGEPQRSSHSNQMSVAVRFVSACSASVSVESLRSGSDYYAVVQASCPVLVSHQLTFVGDPSGALAADAVAPDDDPTAQYTIRVEF